MGTADMAELVDALVSGTSGSNTLEVRVFLSAPLFGVVAQLIERYVRIVEVVGLSPISSTNFLVVYKSSGIWRNGRR